MEAISPYQHTAQMYLMLKRAEVATEEHSTEYNHNINIQKIKSLNLTNHVAIPYLMMVSKCISELKSLSLERCDFGDEGAVSLSLAFPNLKKLSMRVNHIGFKGVEAICNNLSDLQQLDLELNNIYDECGIMISRKLKKLRGLNLNRNKIEEATIIKISKNLKNLTYFGVNFTNTCKKTRQYIKYAVENKKVQ